MIYITLFEYMDILTPAKKIYEEYRQEYKLHHPHERYYESDSSIFKEITEELEFESKIDLERFLLDYSYDIFAKALPKIPIFELNKLYYEKVSEGNEVCVLMQGFESIITNTFVFLASNKFICNNIKFLMNYDNIKADEFITNNTFLNEK